MWTIASGKVIAPIFTNMTHKLASNILITCAHFFMNTLPWGGQSSAKHHPPPPTPNSLMKPSPMSTAYYLLGAALQSITGSLEGMVESNSIKLRSEPQ